MIYINDLHTVSPDLNFLLFADDTNIFYKHKDADSLTQILNVELKKVNEWIRANKLQLNYDKTHIMVFNAGKANMNKI